MEEKKEFKFLIDLRKNFINPQLFPSDEFMGYDDSQQDVLANIARFDSFFSNSIGDANFRKQVFSKIIEEIYNSLSGKRIVLHILGHGVILNNDTEDCIGVEFAKWDFFAHCFNQLKNRNHLILNLMNICKSDSIAEYCCFNQLYSITTRTNDNISPYLIYDLDDFGLFVQELKRQQLPLADNYRCHFF